MTRVRVFVLPLVLACGAADSADSTGDSTRDSTSDSAGDSTSGAEAGSTPESELEPAQSEASPQESRLCLDSRDAILSAIEESSQKPCAADAECRTVMNPRHPTEEMALVASAADADALTARASEHLERCGATAHHEAMEEAFVVVEARCVEARCVASETTYHPEPID